MKKNVKIISFLLLYVFCIVNILNASALKVNACEQCDYKVLSIKDQKNGVYGYVYHVIQFKDCGVVRSDEGIFLIKNGKVVKEFSAPSRYEGYLGRYNDEVIFVSGKYLVYVNVKNETMRKESLNIKDSISGAKLNLMDGTVDDQGNKWIQCGYIKKDKNNYDQVFYKLLRVNKENQQINEVKDNIEGANILGNDSNGNLLFSKFKEDSVGEYNIKKVDNNASVSNIFVADLEGNYEAKVKLDKKKNYWVFNGYNKVKKFNPSGKEVNSYELKENVRDIQFDKDNNLYVLYSENSYEENDKYIERLVGDKFISQCILKEDARDFSIYDNNNLILSDREEHVSVIENGQQKHVRNKEVGIGQNPSIANNNDNLFLVSNGRNEKMNMLEIKNGELNNTNLLDIKNNSKVDYSNGYLYVLNNNTLTKLDNNNKIINKINLKLNDQESIETFKISEDGFIYLRKSQDIIVVSPQGQILKQITLNDLVEEMKMDTSELYFSQFVKDCNNDIYINCSNSQGEKLIKIVNHDEFQHINFKDKDYNGFFLDKDNNINLYSLKTTNETFVPKVNDIDIYINKNGEFIRNTDLKSRIDKSDLKGIYPDNRISEPYFIRILDLNNKIIVQTTQGLYIKTQKHGMKEIGFNNNPIVCYNINSLSRNKNGNIYVVSDVNRGEEILYIPNDGVQQDIKQKISFDECKRLGTTEDVNNNKQWTIELTKQAKNDENMIKKHVCIMDDYGMKIKCDVKLMADCKNIKVTPLEKYTAGQTYHIVVDKNIISVNGQNFNKIVEKEFTITK